VTKKEIMKFGVV